MVWGWTAPVWCSRGPRLYFKAYNFLSLRGFKSVLGTVWLAEIVFPKFLYWVTSVWNFNAISVFLISSLVSQMCFHQILWHLWLKVYQTNRGVNATCLKMHRLCCQLTVQRLLVILLVQFGFLSISLIIGQVTRIAQVGRCGDLIYRLNVRLLFISRNKCFSRIRLKMSSVIYL